MSAAEAAALKLAAFGAQPRIGIVLGSGLAPLAEIVDGAVVVPYAELPGFPRPTVGGHPGRLVLGQLGGQPVAMLQGRAHVYEQGDAAAMAVPVRALALAGCEILLLTNAAGGIRPDLGPGSLMLIRDHINLTGLNPLQGLPGDDRFVDLTDAWSLRLGTQLAATAARLDIPLAAGIYMFFVGPSFETPAEIRAAGRLGADAVGMSTVPECILARHAGLQVAGLSIITNFAAGIGDAPLDHAGTQATAAAAADQVARLVTGFLEDLGHG